MDKSSGYSGTPLEKKLGLKAGMTARLIQQPAHYFNLFSHPLNGVTFVEDEGQPKDFIHFFSKLASELESMLPLLKPEIRENGCIWVSWPKKASKVPTDVTEDLIRELALSLGLVDVKVCAVDTTWSALKLVIPLKKRK